MQTRVIAPLAAWKREAFTGEIPEKPHHKASMEVLAALYLRLRDEDKEARLDVASSGPRRATIAMAVLEAGEASEANFTNLEFVARRLIRKQGEDCLSREMK